MCLSFQNATLFGQDPIKPNYGNKYELSIKAGGYYKDFLSKRYIDSTNDIPANKSQYQGFSKVPGCNFFGGISFANRIYKNLYLTSGLMYILRREVLEGNYDSVVKYSASPYPYQYYSIRNVIKYDYLHTNIELSLFMQYKIGKLNLSAGGSFPVWSNSKSSYTYLSTAPTSQKTFREVETPFPSVFFPALQASYDLRIRKLPLSPFIGIDFGKMKSFYLQGGIIIPLLNSARKT